MSYNLCSKYKITGILYNKGYLIFPSIGDENRSDKEYRERRDKDHRKVGDTSITSLFQNIVAHIIHLNICT